MSTNPAHKSVLLHEVCQFFRDCSIKSFVDATLGAGGHAEAILKEHPEIEIFIGMDQDPMALEIAQKRLEPWNNKVLLIHTNFEEMKNHLIKAGLQKVDGILMDLGVSSMQLDQPEKGFSFMKEGPLDMRMNPDNPLTAAEIVNTWSEKELGKIFRDYGEERQWRTAARVIVQARSKSPLQTTLQLEKILYPALSRGAKKGIHPATLVFQALRIAVNRELEVFEQILPEAISCLAQGGRLAVISFHSLEDRLAKTLTRFAASDKYDTSGIGGVFLNKEPLVRLLTRKPIVASEEEIHHNPRSRSAKLRVIEKL